MNYQGRVTDTSGNPLGAGTPVNRKVIFRIWSSASGTSASERLWTEEQTVTIFNGDFSVILGQGSQATGTAAAESRPSLDTVFTGTVTDRYLEIMIDDGNNTIDANDQPITPRQRLTSTSYAFKARFADTVATGAIGTTSLADGNITLAKMATNSIDSSKITNLSITQDDLGNGSVTSGKLGTGAVTSAAILDGTITSTDIGDGTITSSDILDGTIASTDIADGTITSSDILDGTIAATDLANGSATLDKLASNSVNADKIVDGTITAPEIASGAITSDKLSNNIAAGSGSTGGFTFKAGGDADGGLFSSGEGSIELRTNGSPRMTLTNGRVGIGVTPTKGILQVFDGAANGITAHKFLAVDSLGGVGNGTAGSFLASIHADKEIHAAIFRAFSDSRVKNILGRSDAATDLDRILALEVTDYTYRDTISRGSTPQKKLIAQQVESVYPQAVTRSTDEVPDIYKKATIKDGWIALATDLKVGERVRLIAEGSEGVHEVLEVRNGAFRTDFKPAGRDVFVFGRQVTDFRSVDYEAIAMLHVSATQELHRQLTAKDAEIAALRQRVGELEKAGRDQESRLAAIEKRLGGAAEAAVVASPAPARRGSRR